MDDGVEGVLGEQSAEAFGVGDIHGPQPLGVDIAAIPARKVIDHGYAVTLGEQ